MIPGDLPGLLDSWAALPNSNPNACMPMQGGSLYHFYDGLWYDPAERRTHDLPCERRTRYRLSKPASDERVVHEENEPDLQSDISSQDAVAFEISNAYAQNGKCFILEKFNQ